MYENVFFKWPISDLKNFMAFQMIYKLYEKRLTPVRTENMST